MHIKHAPYIRTCVRTVHTHVRTFGMCVYDRCVRVCVLERRCRISVSTRISSESQLPYTPCTDEARFLRMLFTESLYRCSQAQTLLDTYILVRVIHHYVRTHIRRPKKNTCVRIQHGQPPQVQRRSNNEVHTKTTQQDTYVGTTVLVLSTSTYY